MDKKIVIIGSGPTGLGAACRLQELGYNNFLLFERNNYSGGLASSFVDEKGFTWDIGGHVIFSHYKYVDGLFDVLLKEEWVKHKREAWIWFKNKFIPYPFQNNIKYLSNEDILKCLLGILDSSERKKKRLKNFKEWILSTFGEGIADLFMIPYNYKVWACPPENMSYSWIGERVAVIDLKKILTNIYLDKNDSNWGPNNFFRFPLKGGTGAIYKRLFEKIEEKRIFLNHNLIKINTKNKIIEFENGRKEKYDILINTIPLDKFLLISDINNKSAVEKLMHSSTHVIGLGVKGNPNEKLKTKCWIYFPEDNCPFYRATIFSNYSNFNVPDIKNNWSLLLEVSESKYKKVNKNTIIEETIQGAINTKLIEDRKNIISIWYHFEEYGYPVPTIERDSALRIIKRLEEKDIYTRGRFGAWKYEVGNMDHSIMQGVELINRLLKGEKEITIREPNKINSGYKKD